MLKRVVLICLLLFFSAKVKGEKIKFGAYAQNWFAWQDAVHDYDHNEGFTLRRLRIKLKGELEKDISWVCQLGYDKLDPRILDVYLDYKAREGVFLTLGHFTTPGPVSSSFSSSKLDLIERPLLTMRWNGTMNFSSYRSFGLRFKYEFSNVFHWSVMLANPVGGSSGLFQSSTKTEYYEKKDRLGYMTNAGIKIFKDLNLGGFFTYKDKVKNDGAYTPLRTYGFHVIYVLNGLDLKCEWINIDSDHVFPDSKLLTKGDHIGYYLQVGYEVVENYNVFMRYEAFNYDNENDFFHRRISIGHNWLLRKNIRLQINYLRKIKEYPDMVKDYEENMVYMNLQYSVK